MPSLLWFVGFQAPNPLVTFLGFCCAYRVLQVHVAGVPCFSKWKPGSESISNRPCAQDMFRSNGIQSIADGHSFPHFFCKKSCSKQKKVFEPRITLHVRGLALEHALQRAAAGAAAGRPAPGGQRKGQPNESYVGVQSAKSGGHHLGGVHSNSCPPTT